MKRLCRFGFVTVLALSVAATARAQDVPSYSLFVGSGCGADVEGSPGATYSASLNLMLQSSNHPDGDAAEDGAQGWSLSVSSGGVLAIDGITIDGTVSADVDDGGLSDGGFEKSETTGAAEAGSDCEGLNGAVSAIVLSFTEAITLSPEGMDPVASIDVSGPFPAGFEGSNPASLTFVDGCQGAGQPVSNNVTWRGMTVTPALGACDFNLVTGPEPQGCPKDQEGVQVIIQAESLGQVVGDPLAGLMTDVESEGAAQICAEGAEGSTVTATVYAAISSNLSEGAVQGWSLSASVSGDGVTLVNATVDGTAAAEEPEGLEDGGFEKTEIVDPTLNGQGQGAVSAIVLSFTEAIVLEAVGTSTVLCLEIDGTATEPATVGSVVWRDGLTGSGQPVQNVATVDGATVQFLCCQPAEVKFAATQAVTIGPFIRCDPNNDGQNDLADSVWIVSELFRDGTETTCRAAADCNGDNLVDLADATYGIAYQFQGGSPPPAPFPDCGVIGPLDPADAEGLLGCDEIPLACAR